MVWKDKARLGISSIEDLSSRHVLRNRRKPAKYIMKILSSDPLLTGFSSPAPFADQRTRLNAAMVLHRLFSSAEELYTWVHNTDRHRAQDSDCSVLERKLDGELVLRNR